MQSESKEHTLRGVMDTVRFYRFKHPRWGWYGSYTLDKLLEMLRPVIADAQPGNITLDIEVVEMSQDEWDRLPTPDSQGEMVIDPTDY
jgi:hypothetical protein